MNKLKQVKLGLGLIVISSWFGALAAPVAEDSKKRATGINFTQIENVFYNAQLHFNALYGDKDNSHASANFMQPVWGDANKMLFVDARAMLKQSPIREFSVGGGYRWLTDDKDYLFGVYSLYDNKTSYYNNNYHQLTLGGEFKTDKWSLGMNYYLALGTQVNDVSIKTSGRAIPTSSFDQFEIELVDTFNKEYAMEGYDVEVGYEVPEVPGLTTYVAGFDFYHKSTASVSGGRLSLEYDVLQHLPKKPKWLGTLSVVTTVQNDNLRNTLWFAGVNLTIPFSEVKNKRAYVGLEHKMLAPIRRDVDVITKDAENENVFTWTKDDGKHYTGMFVMSEENLKTVTATGITIPDPNDSTKQKTGRIEGIDIVGVIGDIRIQGNPLKNDVGRPEAATEAAIVLNDGQIITGRNITIEVNGRTYTVAVVNSDSGLLFASPDNPTGSLTLVQTDADGKKQVTSSLLRLHTSDDTSPIGNHIEDVIFNVDAGDPDVKTRQRVFDEDENGNSIIVEKEIALGQQAAAITNVLGAIGSNMPDPKCTGPCESYESYSSNFHSFGNLYIKNVDLVGGGIVYLFDTVSGTQNSLTGRYIEPSSVRIEGGDYNVINPYIGRNYSGETGAGESYEFSEIVGAITINTASFSYVDVRSIENVSINIQQKLLSSSHESPTVAGISLSSLSGTVKGNTISVEAEQPRYGAMGIHVLNSVTGSIGCSSVDENCGNTINRVFSSFYSIGIKVTETPNSRFLGLISNNTIGRSGEIAIKGTHPRGIVISSGIGLHDKPAYINDNQLLGDIVARQDIPEAGGSSAGIVFFGELSEGSQINNNTILSITGLQGETSSYGIVASDDASVSRGSIDNNQFGLNDVGKRFISDSNAYGISVGYLAPTGSISNNQYDGQIESVSTTGSALGIHVREILSGKVEKNVFGSIKTNTTPIIKGGGQLAAILAGSSICCGFGSINDNTILSPLSGNGDVYGIAVAGEVGGQINHNQFGTSGVDNDVLVGVKHVAAINVGSIASDGEVQHNRYFGKIRSTGNAIVENGRLSTSAGYIASGRVEGAIQNNDFTGTIESLGSSYGVSITGSLTSALSNYNFNAFDDDQDFIIKGAEARGLFISAIEEDVVVSNNTFAKKIIADVANAEHVDRAAIGINVDTSIQKNSQIKDNTFADIIAGNATTNSNAAGVFISGYNAGSVLNNKFNGAIASGTAADFSQAVGIMAIGGLTDTGAILDNLFSTTATIISGAVTGDDAFKSEASGISIIGDIAGSITTNHFNGEIKSSASTISSLAGGIFSNGGLTATTAHITNNTFATITAGVANGRDSQAAGISIIGDIAGTITSNHFNGEIKSSTVARHSIARGIFAGGLTEKGEISDNVFAAAATITAGVANGGESQAVGILILQDVAGTIKTNEFNGTISSNTAATSSKAHGIHSSGGLTGTGVISGNIFTAAATITAGVATGGVSQAIGIFPIGNIAGTIKTNEFNGEIKSSAGASSDAFGVKVGKGLGTDSSISNNTFGAITSGTGDDSDVFGVKVGDMGTGSSISNNTFGAITSNGTGAGADAYGVMVLSMSTGSSISNNKFTGEIKSGTGINSGAFGVRVTGTMNGTIGCATGAVIATCSNTFSAITSGAGENSYAAGVNVHNMGAGRISGNKFTGEITSNGTGENPGAYGVMVTGTMSGTIANNTFNGMINAISGLTAGIYLNEALTGTVVNNIQTNIFTFSLANTDAVGISLAKGSLAADIGTLIGANTITGTTEANKVVIRTE